jgi:hypothetical protein
MSCNCHQCRNQKADLRDGAGRLNRLLHWLDPKNVPLDDRKIEDLLGFVHAYAEKIRFFQVPQDDDGSIVTWQAFLERDMAVILSAVVLTDTAAAEKQYKAFREQLYQTKSKEDFSRLFEPIFALAKQIGKWYEQAVPDNPIQKDIGLLIQSSLSPQLQKSFQYALAHDKHLTLKLTGFTIEETGIWGFTPLNLEKDDTIFHITHSTDDEENLPMDDLDPLIEASFYIDDIFQAFQKALLDIVAKSRGYLDFALNEYPKHQPHLALFIAFLELFQHLQNDLNDLTRRHLDFFFRDVLHLSERPAIPDQVYAIFELAKGVNEYIVEDQTPLLAGKDALGKDIVYKTGDVNSNKMAPPEPFVPNRAIVKEIKNIYLERNDEKTQIKMIHANPVANSADGKGVPFARPSRSFDTFGVGGRDEARKMTLCNFNQQSTGDRNPGRVGFALATPQLLLAGGMRTIELKVSGLEKILAAATSLENVLEIWLTGEKKWEGATYGDANDYSITWNESGTKVLINIPVAAPKIVPFNEKIHPGDIFPTISPVLKVVLKNLDQENFGANPVPNYEDLLLDAGFNITVTVGDPNNSNTGKPENGLKDLILQNAIQKLENGKSFFAFTQMPSNGAQLYVGSKEFFSKNISSFKVNINWIGTPNPTPTLGLAYLKDKTWSTIQGTPGTKITSPIGRNANYSSINEYNIETVGGFLRINLTDVTLTSVTLSSAKGLELQADYISIQYSSELSFKNLAPGVDQFFHLYPFGIVETYPTKDFGEVIQMEESTGGLFVNTQVPGTDIKPSWYLLPQFEFGTPLDRVLLANERHQYNQAFRQAGHLLIGIEELSLPRNLSLLFKFEEGTQADDDGTPPSVHWSYLTQNEWHPLPFDAILTDGTYGLQTSGLMIFSLPVDMTDTNSILPAGQRWLCASVDDNPDRFPRLISVTAQAVIATFANQENDPAHFDSPLVKGSVTRLKDKVDSVQSVEQPYESFGGRPADTGNTFYMEASERIRHKGRAITIWDYEHLVLSRFPAVFKVKAIPVTDPDCICTTSKNASVCAPEAAKKAPKASCGPQKAPGHVLVVPIPDFRNRVGGNRLQPKNSNLILQEIEKYLSRRVSPFVKVRAKNPVYEEVLVSFQVQFMPGIDKGTFIRLLNQELVHYLTPWAFEDSVDVRFDGRVYASDVINFIEERPYVDFITDFRMFHCKEDCGIAANKDELMEIKGTIIEVIEGKDENGNSIKVDKPIGGALIQIIGTNIQLQSDTTGVFKILLADGDRIAVTNAEHGTRIFRFTKQGTALKLTDESNGALFDLVQSTNGWTVQPAIVLESASKFDPTTSVTTPIKSTLNLSNKLTGTPIAPSNTIKVTFTVNEEPIEKDELKINDIVTIKAVETIPATPPSTTPTIIEYAEKTVTIGLATLDVQLYPSVIKGLQIKVRVSGKSNTDISTAEVHNFYDERIKALKSKVADAKPGDYEFESIQMGSVIVVSAEGFMPRLIGITEKNLNIVQGANPAISIEVALLPDCIDQLDSTDELIEFWETVLHTYYPNVRGMELSIRPSTARSILVSSAQHWIDLYQAPEQTDPCSPTQHVRKRSATLPDVVSGPTDTDNTFSGNTGNTLSNQTVNGRNIHSFENVLYAPFRKKYQYAQIRPYLVKQWGEGPIDQVIGIDSTVYYNQHIDSLVRPVKIYNSGDIQLSTDLPAQALARKEVRSLISNFNPNLGLKNKFSI